MAPAKSPGLSAADPRGGQSIETHGVLGISPNSGHVFLIGGEEAAELVQGETIPGPGLYGKGIDLLEGIVFDDLLDLGLAQYDPKGVEDVVLRLSCQGKAHEPVLNHILIELSEGDRAELGKNIFFKVSSALFRRGPRKVSAFRVLPADPPAYVPLEKVRRILLERCLWLPVGLDRPVNEIGREPFIAAACRMESLFAREPIIPVAASPPDVKGSLHSHILHV